MSRELLASGKNNSGILLDPRTKLAVLITIAVFILGGSYEGVMQYYIPHARPLESRLRMGQKLA